MHAGIGGCVASASSPPPLARLRDSPLTGGGKGSLDARAPRPGAAPAPVTTPEVDVIDLITPPSTGGASPRGVGQTQRAPTSPLPWRQAGQQQQGHRSVLALVRTVLAAFAILPFTTVRRIALAAWAWLAGSCWAVLRYSWSRRRQRRSLIRPCTAVEEPAGMSRATT
jgi:hypothetical protein